MLEYLPLVAAVLVMSLGLIGIFLPILPGIPYMLIVVLVYGLATDFATLSTAEVWWLIALVLISIAIDYFSGVIGAKYGGAARQSLIAGFIGFVLGLILFPPFGGFVGLFAGILVSELVRGRSRLQALKAAKSGLIGTAVGIIINFIIAIAFIVSFIIAALST